MKLFMKRNRRVLVFTTVVMLFLVGVGVIQLVVNQYRPLKDTAVVKVEDNKDKDTDKEDPQAPAEKMVKPVGDDIKIVKKFYDSSLSDEELEIIQSMPGVYFRPRTRKQTIISDGTLKRWQLLGFSSYHHFLGFNAFNNCVGGASEVDLMAHLEDTLASNKRSN